LIFGAKVRTIVFMPQVLCQKKFVKKNFKLLIISNKDFEKFVMPTFIAIFEQIL